jgi:WhiB family redox-sensing transcriptional regulator
MITDILNWAATIPAWMTKASCSTGDVLGPDAWFPTTAQQAELPKQICTDCPVRQKCLEFAFEIGDLDNGIYGGLTARERRALVRKGKHDAA